MSKHVRNKEVSASVQPTQYDIDIVIKFAQEMKAGFRLVTLALLLLSFSTLYLAFFK
jgi:hypothetical protein